MDEVKSENIISIMPIFVMNERASRRVSLSRPLLFVVDGGGEILLPSRFDVVSASERESEWSYLISEEVIISRLSANISLE